MKQRFIQISTLLIAVGIVSACSNLPGMQKTSILQGNEVEETRLAQIKPGMAQVDVQRILGTPLVNDPYHPNIWYYTFLHALSTGEEVDQQNVQIIFDRNKKVQSVHTLQ